MTEADDVVFECETEAGGALSESANVDDLPVLHGLQPRRFRQVLHPCRSAGVRSRPLRARAVVERRAKRRAVPEAGSDFEAAFTRCEESSCSLGSCQCHLA